MKFNPIDDKIVVKLLEEEKKTSGGIFITNTEQSQPYTAEVLAVGQGGRTKNGQLIPMTVKTGDIVMFTKGLGQKVKLDGEDYVVLIESDLLGIVEKE